MQLLMVIRDPVEHAFSSYNYFIAHLHHHLQILGVKGLFDPEPFLDMVKRKVAQLESAGLNPGSGTLLICLFYSYACKFHSNGHHKS